MKTKLTSSVTDVLQRAKAAEIFNQELVRNLRAERMACPVKAALVSAMCYMQMAPFEVWAGMVQTALPELADLAKMKEYMEHEDYTFMGTASPSGAIQLLAFIQELQKH